MSTSGTRAPHPTRESDTDLRRQSRTAAGAHPGLGLAVAILQVCASSAGGAS
jgi:hypothetical protein